MPDQRANGDTTFTPAELEALARHVVACDSQINDLRRAAEAASKQHTDAVVSATVRRRQLRRLMVVAKLDAVRVGDWVIRTDPDADKGVAVQAIPKTFAEVLGDKPLEVPW